MIRDPQQRQVIELDSGYHLILAPAGCGKTDILAERVERAIDKGVPIEKMLCLTFTNRASRGMKERIRRNVGDKASGLFVGNTHRFCSKFLFDNNIIGPSTAILDEDEQLSIAFKTASSCVKALENKSSLEEEEGEFKADFHTKRILTAIIQLQHTMTQYRLGQPKDIILVKTSDYSDESKLERFFYPQKFASLCKTAGLPVSLQSVVFIYDNIDSYLKSDEMVGLYDLLELMKAAKSFELYKERMNALDFDDLLILTYDYAVKNRASINKYSWVQIDEVQDLNRLQFSLVDLFTEKENVTLYLGDEQQAIFSFIGASLKTMEWLKQRCGDNIIHLATCYRSPKYLLDIFNNYALLQLGTPSEFLPIPNRFDSPMPGDLRVHHSDSHISGPASVVKIIEKEFPRAKTAVIVSKNDFADNISELFDSRSIPHFKISGQDLFSQKEVRFLFAHLAVVLNDINYIAWARILSFLKVLPKYSEAREFVNQMKNIALNPSDFLLFPKSSYIQNFARAFGERLIVVFDTETTGLDIYEDDIVQIAAIKYFRGEIVDRLNILLHTERPIPLYLGDIPNPLIDEYEQKPHSDRKEGLQRFLDFAKGSVILGHNVMYDYNILLNNCKRSLQAADLTDYFTEIYDTLKLSRLILPNLRSYKLKDLLEVMNVEGKNSHLADEDIEATLNVAIFCYDETLKILPAIEDFLSLNSAISELLNKRYGDLYRSALSDLYVRYEAEQPGIVAELIKVYDVLADAGFIQAFPKFEYLLKFIERSVVDPAKEKSLYEQIYNHIMELNTFKEADLCESGVIDEQIFVATVHKAKGLEFENVIVYGCNDGIYPFFANKEDAEAVNEDARKLYVAMSRAMKRLCFLVFDHNKGINRFGNQYCFDAEISPFLLSTLRDFRFLSTTDKDLEENPSEK